MIRHQGPVPKNTRCQRVTQNPCGVQEQHALPTVANSGQWMLYSWCNLLQQVATAASAHTFIRFVRPAMESGVSNSAFSLPSIPAGPSPTQSSPQSSTSRAPRHRQRIVCVQTVPRLQTCCASISNISSHCVVRVQCGCFIGDTGRTVLSYREGRTGRLLAFRGTI